MTAAAAQLDNVLKTAPTSDISNNREDASWTPKRRTILADRGRATAQSAVFAVGTGKFSKFSLKNT